MNAPTAAPRRRPLTARALLLFAMLLASLPAQAFPPRVDFPELRLAADRDEATAADWKACVEAGACSEPNLKGRTLANQQARPSNEGRFFNWGVPGRDSHPINGISFMQAEAFCRWRGGRLPTLSEWGRMAGLAGFSESELEMTTSGRLFPWGGAAPDETRANFGRAMDISEVITEFFQTEAIELRSLYRLPETCRLDVLPSVIPGAENDLPELCGRLRRAWKESLERAEAQTKASGGAGTRPVGSFSPAGDTPEGLRDMAGNVWEWVRSDVPCGAPLLAGGAWTSISLERCSRELPPPAPAPVGLGDTNCLDHLRLRPGGNLSREESASDVGFRCVYGRGLAPEEMSLEKAMAQRGYGRRKFGPLGLEARFVPEAHVWMSTQRADVSNYKKCVDAGACTLPLRYAPPPPPMKKGCGCHCPLQEAEGIWAKTQLILAGLSSFSNTALREVFSCWCALCDDRRPRMMGYNYGAPGDPDTTPVNGVTHAQAEAFCRWAGGRLPETSQWLAAAMARVKVGRCPAAKPFEDMDKNDRSWAALQKSLSASGRYEETIPGAHEWTADLYP